MGNANRTALRVGGHDVDPAPTIASRLDVIDELNDDQAASMRRLDSQPKLRLAGLNHHVTDLSNVFAAEAPAGLAAGRLLRLVGWPSYRTT
jgi:hypothetical protein